VPEVGKFKTRNEAMRERERGREEGRGGGGENQTGIYPASEEENKGEGREEVDHRRVSAASLTIAGGSSTPRS